MQVPLASLFDGGKGPGVWVVVGSPARVAWRPVSIVQLDQESARVRDGLKPGERIVALGAHLLREGEQVRLAGQAAAATEGVRP
jgi:multidrug efflux pump subunit AcrA (membrane-fusion protein)